MDKFLLPIDPVFGKSFCLYEAEKDFYKNRIIFLDEIDASKEVMVNRIVEDEVSHYVNQIELFVKLHDCFEKQSFHSDLLQKKKSSFADDIQKLYKKGHEIFVQYNLKNGNIQISKEMKAETDFLFHDGTYFTALNRTEGHSYYSIDFDEEKNCNIISVVTGEKPENELGDLIRVCGTSFMSLFCSLQVWRTRSYIERTAGRGKRNTWLILRMPCRSWQRNLFTFPEKNRNSY